ncbi:hypothetical protein HYW83_05565 [Candidatus Peregrinibacteria bacterium]|nr:hypothetical protein [Candidatus Peregrinibacteria bacterium]
MDRPFDRVALVVLDGVGCGQAEDTGTEFPEDVGANSLVHASQVKPIDAEALRNIGLQQIPGLTGLQLIRQTAWNHVRGAVGAIEPRFAGNGSPEGHQALMGHRVKTPYRLFNKTGFPPELIARIEHKVEGVVGRPVKAIRYPETDDINGEKFFTHPSIGNVHYGSRDPSQPFFLPIYASSDSLVQVALHLDVLPLEMMEAIARAIRTRALVGEFANVARVILRVWRGEPGKFERVSELRKDLGVNPDGLTLIDHLVEKGISVFAVGKTAEMLNDRGFSEKRIKKGDTDDERIMEVARRMREEPDDRFVFANLKYTDEKSGHKREPGLYVDHIEAASRGIGAVIQAMGQRDLLVVTSDHGNDPTHPNHTNHTRECSPLLVYSPRMIKPVELGVRESHADVAATLAEIFGVEDRIGEGTSFLRELLAA